MSPPMASRRDPTMLSPDDEYKEPLSGMVISVILAMMSMAIISSFTSKKDSQLRITSCYICGGGMLTGTKLKDFSR